MTSSFLRKNTAVRICVGPFLDKTDGVTPEVALTVTACHITAILEDDDNTACNLIIDADATASGGNNDMVHITDDNAGYYDLELTQAQTNYNGRFKLAITDAANHCPVFHEFMILPAMVFDSLVKGTDDLDVNATKINDVATTSVTTINANQGTTQPVNFTGTGASALVKGDTVDIAGAAVNAAAAQLGVNVVQLGADAQTVTDLKDFADTGYNPITHKVAGVVLTDTCTTNTDMRGTNSAALASVCTEARLAELDAANLPANIDTIAIDVAGLDGAAMRGTDSAALATALSTAQSDLTQIKGDTTTDIPAQLTAIAAYLDTEIADILTDTGTTIPALIAALNNLSIADVRTILGVNSSNQCAELSQAAPAATPSIAAAVMLAYMKLRNKETATSIAGSTAERAIYNDAGTKIAKAVVSDDGTTFTKAEFGSGA